MHFPPFILDEDQTFQRASIEKSATGVKKIVLT